MNGIYSFHLVSFAGGGRRADLSGYVKIICCGHPWLGLRRVRLFLCMGFVVFALGGQAAMDTWAAEFDADYSRIDHYTNEGGDFGFVLDQSSRPSVMRFDASPEILVLTSVPGPRGDTIYKLDNGTAILRQTLIGGMTLFDATRPEGRPVVKDGAGAPLVLPRKDPAQIRARARVLADRLSTKLNRDITFGMNWNAAPDDRLVLATLADAVELTAVALNRIADDDLGREALAARLSRITFLPGDAAQPELKAETLVIIYNGAKGVQGRLSSDALVRYLESVL